jgi:hypothetical protein
MKIAMVSLSLFFLFVGCARSRVAGDRSVTPLSRGDTRWESCFPGRHYSEEDTALMLRMREDGAGLADVAKKIGGTRQEVRCAEARARGRIEAAHLASGSSRK